MRTDLASSETSLLRQVIESMRSHLELEERYLLAAQAIRA
jgi:hypothetical protein